MSTHWTSCPRLPITSCDGAEHAEHQLLSTSCSTNNTKNVKLDPRSELSHGQPCIARRPGYTRDFQSQVSHPEAVPPRGTLLKQYHKSLEQMSSLTARHQISHNPAQLWNSWPFRHNSSSHSAPFHPSGDQGTQSVPHEEALRPYSSHTTACCANVSKHLRVEPNDVLDARRQTTKPRQNIQPIFPIPTYLVVTAPTRRRRLAHLRNPRSECECSFVSPTTSQWRSSRGEAAPTSRTRPVARRHSSHVHGRMPRHCLRSTCSDRQRIN